ncbi:hypothetical protein CLOM_g24162 [Closterium sp. NIES-68]|nr:hypothetical protein CLOM_g3110 [Closterium sp. NIES-68]GJP39822.1 hypothetical protein CLOM_g24162 [Closterium sp. NIES-68]
MELGPLGWGNLSLTVTAANWLGTTKLGWQGWPTWMDWLGRDKCQNWGSYREGIFVLMGFPWLGTLLGPSLSSLSFYPNLSLAPLIPCEILEL